MTVKDQPKGEIEKSEFPVDARPLIGSLLLLAVVFVGLCATVYFQNSAESFGLGNILLALAFGFAAYVQRGDSFRVLCILVGGAVICFFVYLFGSGAEDIPENARKSKPAKSISADNFPEGLSDR